MLASDVESWRARAAGAPEDVDAHFALGVLLLAGGAAGERPRAVEALRTAAGLAPGRGDVRAALGHALALSGDVVPGAANALYGACRLDPDNALFQAYHLTILAAHAPPDMAGDARKRLDALQLPDPPAAFDAWLQDRARALTGDLT